MKTCTKCKELKPRSEFHIDKRPRRDLQAYCKSCNRVRQQKWRDSHRSELKDRYKITYANGAKYVAHIRRKYGITKDEYDKLLSDQNSKCAICGCLDPGGKGAKKMHVDHDHKTGEIRGLLCSKCNRMIGCANDNPDVLKSATVYLQSLRSARKRSSGPSPKRARTARSSE